MRFNKIVLSVLLLQLVITASAFEKSWVLGLRADFGGSLTVPSIPLVDLKQLNPAATNMTGMLSPLVMGGQLTVGYIFDTNELFPAIPEDSVFSGIGLHGYLGFGQGNTSQKISALVGSDPIEIFMVVDFEPILNFGVEGEAYFFNNRFSVGLGLGTKMIADMTPQYLVYSTDPKLSQIDTEVGTIIVSPDMMTKMNAFAFSSKLDLAYHVPILPTTELILGFFTQFNVYQPKYLTVPPSLIEVAEEAAALAGTEFNIDRPFPDYWLNSLDFGATLGFLFRL